MGKIRAMSLFYKSIDNQLNKINEEHMTHNQVVAGSSPAGPTLKMKHLRHELEIKMRIQLLALFILMGGTACSARTLQLNHNAALR